MVFIIFTRLVTSADAGKLPNTPVAIKNDKHEEKIKYFPGTSRNQPVSVMLNSALFIFNGAGKENGSAIIRLLRDAYKYPPQLDSWEHVNTEILF